jgi:hypothetical protein
MAFFRQIGAHYGSDLSPAAPRIKHVNSTTTLNQTHNQPQFFCDCTMIPPAKAQCEQGASPPQAGRQKVDQRFSGA